MDLPGRWRRSRTRSMLTRRRLLASTLALLVLVGLGAVNAIANTPVTVRQQDQFLAMPQAPGSAEQVSIDTSFFTTGSSPRPAVLLAHGFGGSKTDEADEARKLARSGYAVLTWSSRGFGHSTGQIGLDSPDGEVQDVKHLVDWLTARPEVLKDKPGDPVVGITGASYGGAISLLAAAADPGSRPSRRGSPGGTCRRRSSRRTSRAAARSTGSSRSSGPGSSSPTARPAT